MVSFSRSFLALGFVVLLAGCAAAPPIRTAEMQDSVTTPSGGRVAHLEQSAKLLRQQYEAMGETLQWMEGEIKGLKAQKEAQKEARQEETPEAPKAVIKKPINLTPTKAEPKKTEPKIAVKEEAKPTETALPETVAPLSTDDMAIEPSSSPTPETKADIKAEEPLYLVHIASYREENQVAPGWAEIKAKQGGLLAGLTPYATSFQDDKKRDWLRLNVGTFATREEANARCNALKAAKAGWCDVVKASKSDLKTVN